VGAPTTALRQRACEQRRDEEDRERDPVLRVGDREATGGWNVKPVERGRARQRRDAAQPAAPNRGDDQYARDVDEPERGDRSDPRERVDEGGCGRDGEQRRQRAKRDGRSRGAAQPETLAGAHKP
jgi:hypothetical protein